MYPGKNLQQLITLHTYTALLIEIYITTYYIVLPETWNQNLIKSLAFIVNVQEVPGIRGQIYLRAPQEMQSREFTLSESPQEKQSHFFNQNLKEKNQSPGWWGSTGCSVHCAPKGGGFDFKSGHICGLWV